MKQSNQSSMGGTSFSAFVLRFISNGIYDIMNMRALLKQHYEGEEVLLWLRSFSYPRGEEGTMYCQRGILQVFQDCVVLQGLGKPGLIRLDEIVIVELADDDEDEYEVEIDEDDDGGGSMEIDVWEGWTLQEFNTKYEEWMKSQREAEE